MLSGKGWSHHHCKSSKNVWDVAAGERFNGECSGAALVLGLNDLKGFFPALMIL